ncbi:16S rRNA pseudouridine(516) synthase [Streptococcus oricebi]|uniref:Pseudouridine synthase n=1 Tax=Streptococcus oricebi TaxID=1547447 RepID=A0ABS5B1M5_9STRE|nr:16S rRNA pseudouridine(516) synthase [Streptococcus oricebi]MBP2622733.1 16S rRNA pseudouridine(516) synthase [Streptococcus oricebi]
MRLDKLLALNQISRKKMKQALLRQQILVDKQAARKLSQNVDTGLQEISLEQKSLQAPSHRYYLLNKPAGVLTANKDAEKRTVMDLLAPSDYSSDLYAIGRLDRDTRGLLILTDNGPLGFQLLHPQYHVQKTYYVEVNGPLNNSAIEAFERGIIFHDGTVCQSAQLTIHQSQHHKSSASVCLSQGKFHQVKKMFLSVGVKVIYLQRTHFGPFELDPELAEGSYRPFHSQELETIKLLLEKTR